MKSSFAVLALITTYAFAADVSVSGAPAAKPSPAMHRYIIERTFPAGALAGLDAETKTKVNVANSTVGVRWIQSYANADKTKTFCVYEGPSEAAIRKAAELNKLPVDSITEIPLTIRSK